MRVLVTGGARSGKSSFAEAYAAHLGRSGAYIATAQIFDEEMRQRVALHRRRRETSGFRWTTLEEPYELVSTLKRLLGGVHDGAAEDPGGAESAPAVGGTGAAEVIVVDCLTLWLSNWLLRYERHIDMPELVLGKVNELVRAVGDPRFSGGRAARDPSGGPHVLFVTNEVGDGIVPEYPLGRHFRDLAGMMNQRLAAVCDQVFLVTCGIPMELKSRAFRLMSDGSEPAGNG